MSLARFHQAQSSSSEGYSTALAEMNAGHKRSHWIWYIFPQIDGLGHSSTAREYALPDLEAALEYLRDPILRARYEEIASTVRRQLAGNVPLETLMGGSTDALKLTSSVTLFHAAATALGKSDPTFSPLAQLCATLLQQIAVHGYPPCAFTLAKVRMAPDA